MARTRQIKPEFYQDDELCSLPRDARLLFPGLWTLADRRGRLEDRPAKIKALIFPYDQDLDHVAVDCLLEALGTGGFIIRYSVGEKRYIQIKNFEKHQNCHFREPESKIPPPPSHTNPPAQNGTGQGQGTTKPEASPSLALDKPQSSPAAYGFQLSESLLKQEAPPLAALNPPAKRKTKPQKLCSPEALSLAEELKAAIHARDPMAQAGREGNCVSWGREIDVLLQRGRSPTEISQAIEYAHSPGCFWGPNILSGKKLREKFDTVWGQMLAAKKAKKADIWAEFETGEDCDESNSESVSHAVRS